MFIPTFDDVIRVRLSGTLPDSVPWVANLYEQFTIGLPTINLALANSYYDGIVAAYQSNNFDDHLSTLWSLTSVELTDMTVEGGTSAISSHAAINGTDSTNPLPNQTSLVTTWRTAVNTRNFRGRTFHPGFTEGDSGGNNPGSTTISTYSDWADDVTAFLKDGTDRFQVIVSYFDGMELVGGPHNQVLWRPKPRAAGIAEEVTSHVTRTAWSTQRRRALPS